MSENSYFLRHAPCPQCNSRDNLAIYSDGGGWCFGCGYLIPSKVSGYITSMEVEESSLGVHLPPDHTREYPPEAVDWTIKYGINSGILMNRDVWWSPSRRELMFTWWDEDKNPRKLIAYQSRTFREGQPKYISRGDFDTLLPIYHVDKNKKLDKRLVIVEDCISAIKIANCVADAIPCLKSSMSREKLTWLANKYTEMVIWLDDDMYKKALEMSDTLEWMGVNVHVIQSTGDPKDHRYSDLTRMINWVDVKVS
jgi:hypothetical protein